MPKSTIWNFPSPCLSYSDAFKINDYLPIMILTLTYCDSKLRGEYGMYNARYVNKGSKSSLTISQFGSLIIIIKWLYDYVYLICGLCRVIFLYTKPLFWNIYKVFNYPYFLSIKTLNKSICLHKNRNFLFLINNVFL